MVKQKENVKNSALARREIFNILSDDITKIARKWMPIELT